MQDLIRQWGALALGLFVLAVIAVRLCFPSEKRDEGGSDDGGSWFGSDHGGHYGDGDGGGDDGGGH